MEDGAHLIEPFTLVFYCELQVVANDVEHCHENRPRRLANSRSPAVEIFARRTQNRPGAFVAPEELHHPLHQLRVGVCFPVHTASCGTAYHLTNPYHASLMFATAPTSQLLGVTVWLSCRTSSNSLSALQMVPGIASHLTNCKAR
jgi:hypothetical protein